jgi:CBS domain-containing protein
MRISELLRVKGDEVVTVAPATEVGQLAELLAERHIGAVVVSRDGRTVEGIVSERDIVRALATRGTSVLSEPLTEIYTSEVFTATPDSKTEDLMRLMTDKRIRHVPVLVDGQLAGIVSIGDVVKNRIGELEAERAALNSYIATAR